MMRISKRTLSRMIPLALAGVMSSAVQAQSSSEVEGFTLTWEGAALGVSRNNVRIPGDTGTRFDMTELTGSGPELAMRFYAQYDFNSRHSLRLNLAPLEITGTGTLAQNVNFADEQFMANEPIHGTYNFSNYRLGYRYTFIRNAQWEVGAGLTAFIRDAKIRLRQQDTEAQDDDTGFVPLLNFYAAYHINPRHSIVLDVEGAGASQGRAIDAALTYQYHLPSGWSVAAGYRTLEGGADNDDVYNFAWLHYAIVNLTYRF